MLLSGLQNSVLIRHGDRHLRSCPFFCIEADSAAEPFRAGLNVFQSEVIFLFERIFQIKALSVIRNDNLEIFSSTVLTSTLILSASECFIAFVIISCAIR